MILRTDDSSQSKELFDLRRVPQREDAGHVLVGADHYHRTVLADTALFEDVVSLQCAEHLLHVRQSELAGFGLERPRHVRDIEFGVPPAVDQLGVEQIGRQRSFSPVGPILEGLGNSRKKSWARINL